MSNTNRILYIDGIKLFAIILVIIGHCTQHLLSSDPYSEYIYIYIYSFHMPLFMMVSGYFAKSCFKDSAYKSICKKAVQLLLPCITWGGFIILYLYIKGEDIPTDFVLTNLWFLKSLFVCFLFYILIYKTGLSERRIKKITAVIILLLAVQVYPILRLNDMLPAFLTGTLIRGNEKKFFSRSAFIIYSVLFLSFLLIWDCHYFNGVSIHKYPIEFLTRRTIVFTTGLSGSLFFISLFHYIEGYLNKTICIAGQYTKNIYLVQSLLLEIILPNYICIDDLTMLQQAATTIAIVFVILLCSYMLTIITKHNAALNYILWGNIKISTKVQ